MLFHDLGRPAPSVTGLLPLEIEEQTTHLFAICEQRLGSHGVLLIAGDWRSEAALYRVLALSLARMRQRGLSTAIAGVPFIDAEAPDRPDVDVAVLLEARSFTNLRKWIEPQPSRLSILTALDCDLDRKADFEVHVPADRTQHRKSLLRLNESWEEDPQGRHGLVATTLGVDAPQHWRGDLLVHVATVEGMPVPWLSTESPWLAWHALKNRITGELVEQTLLELKEYPMAARRLEARWKLRSSALLESGLT